MEHVAKRRWRRRRRRYCKEVVNTVGVHDLPWLMLPAVARALSFVALRIASENRSSSGIPLTR